MAANRDKSFSYSIAFMGDNGPPSALLTKAQRRFLNGEELSPAEARAIRSRIRQRLQVAFDDLRLILNSEVDKCADDVEKVLADLGAGRVWPLPALLFLWSTQHPMAPDTDLNELFEALWTSGETPPSEQMNRITASFDNQAERGVRAALEFGEFDHVPEDVTNELTIRLGEPLSEMTDEELASLPRETLDLLFRRRDLDRAEYARVMEIKLGREDDEE